MENVVHRLTLDLTKPDVFPRVEVQRDNARTLVISLSQNGRPYWIAEGVTAVFSARKSDGNPLFNACTVEKNTVRYDFTDQTTNVPGIVECEILLYSGDERILASPRFELAVDDLIHQEGDVPESAPEVTALTQMVAAGTAMLEDLGELEEVLEQAERSASLASKMASGAIAAQEAALSAASDAELAKETALTAKVKAEDSADLAAESADTASSKAQEAAVSADRAQQLADGASAAAQSATSSAGRAEAAAVDAAQRAETAAGAADAALAKHNDNLGAHGAVVLKVNTLIERISAALDCDDTTLDQLSEIVSYIKSNKTLIDAITTNKVSVADIVDNLVTNVANKPLSAAQGVALKALIDGLASRTNAALGAHNVNPEAHQDIREKLDFDSGGDGQLLMVTGGRATPLPIGAGLEVRDGRLGVSDIVNLYVCSDGEYTPGSAPVIAEPDESTFYLVPQDSEGVQYASWVYADGAWEFVETLTVTFDEAEDGAPGYTPVKGVDYYTDADKAELVQSVLAALPTWTGGAY